MSESRALGAFADRFGAAAPLVVRSPGRVNLMGEHTDYNQGFVLPMALDRSLFVALRPRVDRRVVLRSLDVDDEQTFELGELRRGTGWIEYVKGVAWALEEGGSRLAGFEGVVAGGVPIGAGLSSSAALEVAAARAFAAVSGLAWDPVAAARSAQRAENAWVGVQCGIMDPLVVAAATPGHALLIDCRDLTLRPVPLPAGNVVAVLDTSTRRGLAASAYNERRTECEAAARILGAPSLRDATEASIGAFRADLGDRLAARARHVVTENARTLEAAQAASGGDAVRLGALMVASHRSLRDDFAVSSDALDAMVAAALHAPGCHGARMTGGGFGGCAVALVEEESADAFVGAVRRSYAAATGLEATVSLCRPGGGVELRRVG